MANNKTDRQNKYQKYLLSEEWAMVRADMIMLNDGKCEECGSRKNLQVHHLTYKNLFHEEPGDLALLCSTCHMAAHGLLKEKKIRRTSKSNSVSKLTVPFYRKKLADRFSIKMKGGRGWIGLARKAAGYFGESFAGNKSAAKRYLKIKLL